jgi:hypothetical protein
MTDAGKKLAGRGGMPAALARSFREELRRVDTAGDGGAVPWDCTRGGSRFAS